MKKAAMALAFVAVVTLASCAKVEGTEDAPSYTVSEVGPFLVYEIPGGNYDGKSIPNLYVVQDKNGDVFGTSHRESKTIGRVVTSVDVNTLVIADDQSPKLLSQATVFELCEELSRRLDVIQSDPEKSVLEKYKNAVRAYKDIDKLSSRAYTLQNDLNEEIVGEK